MNFYTQQLDKKRRKEVEPKLTTLDRVILEKCKFGARIQMILHGCKPYINSQGGKEFASTQEVKRSVLKLEQLGLLVRR